MFLGSISFTASKNTLRELLDMSASRAQRQLFKAQHQHDAAVESQLFVRDLPARFGRIGSFGGEVPVKKKFVCIGVSKMTYAWRAEELFSCNPSKEAH